MLFINNSKFDIIGREKIDLNCCGVAVMVYRFSQLWYCFLNSQPLEFATVYITISSLTFVPGAIELYPGGTNSLTSSVTIDRVCDQPWHSFGPFSACYCRIYSGDQPRQW